MPTITDIGPWSEIKIEIIKILGVLAANISQNPCQHLTWDSLLLPISHEVSKDPVSFTNSWDLMQIGKQIISMRDSDKGIYIIKEFRKISRIKKVNLQNPNKLLIEICFKF